MKDLYKILRVQNDASPEVIKRAYRTLAPQFHPDKGGDEAIMSQLNEAYEVLYDTDKRREYDARWQAYQEADIEVQHIVPISARLDSGNTPPYSQTYKAAHQASVAQYTRQPLAKYHSHPDLQSYTSGIYELSSHGRPTRKYDDIFRYIAAKAAQDLYRPIAEITERLTPLCAIKLFTEFLAGNYGGASLSTINTYFNTQINSLKRQDAQASELLLYTGIAEIISMVDRAQEQKNLIFSLKKITDFAAKAPEVSRTIVTPLFYNKHFRSLHAYGLHLYWHATDGVFDENNAAAFNGYDDATSFLAELRERLSGNTDGDHQTQLIQYVKWLHHFERDLHELGGRAQTAADLRALAFHCLDWLPTLIERSSKQILVTLFIKIGIQFQRAALLEQRPVIKMADEELALKMFLTAVSIGHHATPNIEIYATTQALKCISAFQFQNELLDNVIPALKKRTLILADVFPFFELPQSTVAFFKQGDQMLHLMRHLLKAMIDIYEHNKTNAQSIQLDHSAATVLYQAYEACLKNWYLQEYDPKTEEQFRQDLMSELLFDNSWTFFDVEQNLDSPWIMIDRDEHGFITPTRALPYPDEPGVVHYKSMNGAEINHKTGKINFFMSPWTPDCPVSEKLFTLFDLQELLERNIDGAILSLDPVDADKPYHPFNAIRLSPSQLLESELLNTMLLTDYILKFLTTNQEVQGEYPFKQRPVASMIQHLPAYLRQIIEDFHQAQHSGALHRFWIEAEEIDVAMGNNEHGDEDEKESEDESCTRIGLRELRMTVKKHKMERDIHGELKDTSNDDEGWPIYVLTPTQMQELEQGRRIIPGHAMIFIHAQSKLFYWEHNTLVKAHIPTDYRETLIRLYTEPREPDGKLTQNTKNRPLIYRATKEMARQSGLPHRYSAEFIFAHEFTTHYNEFAQYLPEFGRLKELSKIVTLIRVLKNIRQSNQDLREAIDVCTSTTIPASVPDTEAYRNCQRAKQEISSSIVSMFIELRKEAALPALQRKWQEQLQKIKNDIGTLTFTERSREVEDHCNQWYTQLSRANPGVSSSRLWSEVINPKRAQLAKDITKAKQDSIRSQLTQLFSSQLSSLGSYASGRLINSFMQGEMTPLAEALSRHELKQLAQEIKEKRLPNATIEQVSLALEPTGQATAQLIATNEANRQLRKQKESKDILERGFLEISLGTHAEPISLEGRCLWVPASVRHEVRSDEATGRTRYSFFVYGGVSVQARVNQVKGGGALGGSAVGASLIGQKVYRAWSGDSRPTGASWTTVDPRTVANFRDAAGLPNQNTARFVSEGVLKSTTGVIQRAALPLDGNRGGLTELLIPNAEKNVKVTRVSGVNPPF